MRKDYTIKACQYIVNNKKLDKKILKKGILLV